METSKKLFREAKSCMKICSTLCSGGAASSHRVNFKYRRSCLAIVIFCCFIIFCLTVKAKRPLLPIACNCVVCDLFRGSHSQFGKGARPHLCMDEWNRPTPVLKRLSLTKLFGTSPSQQAWHRSWAQKHGAWKYFHSTPHSIYDLSTQKRGRQVRQGFPKDSA